MMSGSTLLATRPPIIPPEPRPVALDADVATFAETMAAALRKRRRGAGSESFMKNESSETVASNAFRRPLSFLLSPF